MKVLYESYRRHRNINKNNNNNNNNNNNKNGHRDIEICHPNEFLNNNNNNNNNQNDSSTMDDHRGGQNCRHIISVDSLVINKELGIGEFGVVQQGVWTNEEGHRIQVAIKCLSTARLENSRIEFLKEATIMHSISHEHIVTLYGVVLEPSFMLITELAPLRSLLECLKEPALITHFPLTSLCSFAAQIASGMAYLESKRLIHRDLAARNILVFSKTKVKISDFGLSRALGVGKDYYQSNFNVNLKLPIAWCAPECINYLKFTSQSDVWAYGVTLWEMFSFGFQPWAALTGQQILEAIDKPNYQRLERPECCPKEYFQLMLKCWTHEPHLRPKFSEIVSLLPDCKPELLQAIRNSDVSATRKDYLSYKSGEIVTVVDKEVMENTNNCYNKCTESLPLVWKGVTNDRKTGLFNPSDFVAYLGQNLPSTNNSNYSSSTPFSLLSGSNSSNSSNSNNNLHSSLASTITSTVLQSSKFIRGFLESKTNPNGNNSNSSHSPHGVRKNRLRPDMISKPQGDLKHTGHVGADGVFFGDISFLEGKYHPLPAPPPSSKNSSSDLLDNKSNRKITISAPIPNSFNRTSLCSMNNDATNSSSMIKGIYLNSNHEYHEISDEEDLGPLESPPFECLDFGPSLMEEVFRELDHIKPDLNNEAADSEVAINENSINVKNEVRELNLKFNKELINNSNKGKKEFSVKPISEAEQNELDSAIAMAKNLAERAMLEDGLDLNNTKTTTNDSPKTPNSPNKRKFSFKFPTHRSPKSERRTFSEETESIGNIIESITPAAKEAYMSLVDKGVCSTTSSNNNKKDAMEMNPPSPTYDGLNSNNEVDNNPLRMLRTAGIGNVLRPKVRGNRSFSQPRLPTTAQTAGLARVASSRTPLGLPPLVLNEDQSQLSGLQNAGAINSGVGASNALPLPPRDRTSRPLIQLKTHQRRHPLVIPMELSSTMNNNNATTLNGSHHIVGEDNNSLDSLNNIKMSKTSTTFESSSPPLIHRHVPVLKQVSCPQPPAAFLNSYNNQNNKPNHQKSNSFDPQNQVPMPPPKLNRTYLSDDLTETLENEIQKAFDNIKIQNSTQPPTSSTTQQYSNSDIISVPSKIDSSSLLNNEVKPMIPSTFVKCPPNPPPPPKTEKPIEDNPPPVPLEPQPKIQETTNNNFDKIEIKCFTIDNTKNPESKNPTITATNSSSSSSKRNLESDEVRVMQKVLQNEINLSAIECAKILDSTDWDIHKAIKCIRLRQQLRNHNIMVDCDWSKMLAKFNWNIRQASNYLIATQGVPGDEV